MAIYFFYGDEDYNIDLAIEEMKSKLNQDFIAMNFQTLDNPEYSELITALRTPPMMFGDLLIVINADKYFLSSKNFFEDKELEDIEDALSNNPDGLNVVFVVKLPRDENKKIDSRRKFYKILSKYNSKEFPTYKFYETEEIVGWVKRSAKKKDVVINDEAAEFLVEQIGSNLRQLDSELEKLKLLAYPQKTITVKMVEEIAISNQDLFNITELLMKNEKDKALLEFKKITDKKHPLEILAAVQTMLRKWIILKVNSTTMSTFELAKMTGQKEFSVKQTLTKLKNVKVSDLVNLKQNLSDVEYKIKSANSLNDIMEVEIALIK